MDLEKKEPAVEILPPEKPAPAVHKPTRIKRFTIGLNVLIQILIVFFIIVVVNMIGFRQVKRWDMSRDQKYALSPMTVNVLKNLDEPVKAIVFFPQAQSILVDVNSLLREYQYASNKKLTVELVEPYRDIIRARQLAEQYKFGPSDNIVILDYKGRSKFVNAQDMAELDPPTMMGQPPSIRSFKGESAITSALLELTEEKQSKILSVVGHGEVDPQGEQARVLKTFVDRQNIKFDNINLNNVESIPADTSTLMIFGPRSDFSEREIKLLEQFWTERKGRLFILLDPTAKTPRLADFLTSKGVVPRMDYVLRTMNFGGQLALLPAAGEVSSESKEILKELAGGSGGQPFGLQLLGKSTSFSIDRSRTQTENLRFTTLLEASEGYWGETDYEPGERKALFFDPKKDHSAPLVLATAVEQGQIGDARVKVETARMIIIGNAAFLTDQGVQQSELGVDFAINGINWLLNRELISGIPPKPKEPVKLNLDELQMNRLAYGIMGLIPGLAAVIGIFVWAQRKA